MRITVTNSKVYKQVYALTAILGKGMDNYAQVAATEDNQEVLEIYLSAGVSEAEGELRRKLNSSADLDLTVSGSSVTLDLKKPLRADDTVSGLIATSLRLFLAEYVIAAWLGNTPAASLAEGHKVSAAGYLAKVADALDQREAFRLTDEDYTARTEEADTRQADATSPFDARQADAEQIPSSLKVEDASKRASEKALPDETGVSSYSGKQNEASVSEVVDMNHYCLRAEQTASVIAEETVSDFEGRTSEQEMEEQDGTGTFQSRTAESSIFVESAAETYGARTSEDEIPESSAAETYDARTSESEIPERSAAETYGTRTSENEIPESDTVETYGTRTSEDEISQKLDAERYREREGSSSKVIDRSGAAVYDTRQKEQLPTRVRRHYFVSNPDGTLPIEDRPFPLGYER